MKKKSRKRLNAEIILNRKFYDESAVRSTLGEFSGVLSGRVSIQGNAIKVTISRIRGNPDVVRGEFCNYVLASMKNSGLI